MYNTWDNQNYILMIILLNKKRECLRIKCESTLSINSSVGRSKPVNAKISLVDFLHFSASLDPDTHCGEEITSISGLVFELFAVKHSCKCTFVKTLHAATRHLAVAGFISTMFLEYWLVMFFRPSLQNIFIVLHSCINCIKFASCKQYLKMEITSNQRTIKGRFSRAAAVSANGPFAMQQTCNYNTGQ